MKEFEKNVLPHLHNYRHLQFSFSIKTHRQKHAFDLAHGTEAAEKRQKTRHGRGDHQHPNSSREQVRAQQLAEKVAIDERD